MAKAEKLREIRLLTDEPIGGPDSPPDGLGFETYARVLASAALGTKGPFTIGIFGNWGTGKTSLMKMVEGKLLRQNEKQLLTVWFNAWRFEKEEHPIIPLVATIVAAIEKNTAFMDKLGETGNKLVRSLRAIAYGFSTKAKISVPGFAEIEAGFVAKDMIDRDEKLANDPLLDRSLYFRAFESLSKVKMGARTKIVVLIDDLDRCFPDRAVKLLESIKLVLSQPGFVFLLGVARAVLEGYLNHRYSRQFGTSTRHGGAYLDKIVQLPFYVPPHSERMAELWSKLLDRVDPKRRKEFEKLFPVVEHACGANPRASIRFINNLLVDYEISGGQVPISFFAVTRGLQQRWPDLFNILEASTDLCESVIEWHDKKAITVGTKADEPTKKLGNRLELDRELREMLYSEEGLDWLKNTELRHAATQFLLAERETKGRVSRETLLSAIVEGRHTILRQRLAGLYQDAEVAKGMLRKATTAKEKRKLQSQLSKIEAEAFELEMISVEAWKQSTSGLSGEA